jgi:enoyl-CoA hydratase
MTDSVQFEERGRLGVARLNRPKALNALTLEMVRSLHRQIAAWESDRSVHAVMLRGEGRAFCAGGDVRAVHASRHHPPGPGDYKTELFREEFHLMRHIHRFRKPWVALTHGITMGGGAGLSVNGSHCVASESTVFAMPEVFIGSFPDVAATRFLGRTPGKIGLFLSLTGARADAADAMSLGLARHFVPQARFAELTEALASESADVDPVLARFAADPGKSRLAALRPAIDRCFRHDTVEAIVSALRSEDSEWAKVALSAMDRASPLSLKLALRVNQEGAALEIEDALTLEYRAMMHVIAGPDFYEGVRAVLIDKDQKPRWRHSSLADVSEAEVESHFENLGDRELRFEVDGSGKPTHAVEARP